MVAPSADPEATIVIPTRDRHELVRRAVTSALRQTIPVIEVVVVDDGSQPPVSLAPDPRVRLCRLDLPLGVTAARNAGLNIARGRWITFLDDDDELFPHMVERSLETARASRLPPPVAVLSAIETIGDGDRSREVYSPIPIPRGADYLPRRPRHKNTLFVPTAAILEAGGWDEQILSWEHDDLLIRLGNTCSVEALPQVTYRMRQHADARLTRDFGAQAEGIARTLSKHREAFARYPGIRAAYLAQASRGYLLAGRWRDAIRASVASLLLRPGPRAVRQLGVSVAGPRLYAWHARRIGI